MLLSICVYCNKCKSGNFVKKKRKKKKVFGQISKYGFYTNNLSKNDINSLTETFKNPTCQYIN